ncbi:MAG: UDP-N-acetylmuramoyl-tripeptide--D-alanyl-D-alanine ligase [Erysipelotrichaceae bacterium]|nr:UDP-N-acetylmuramoyl-tripeptide--D-alanyl-D-alanine ligase [Erysipelotrichaceae bacterium]
MRAIAVIVLIISVIIPIKHLLHMFQQNRYEVGRMVKWLKDNIGDEVKRMAPYTGAMILLVILGFFAPDTATVLALVVSVLWSLYSIKAESKRSYIKPLVYTARVKRQMITIYVINALFIVCLVVGWGIRIPIACLIVPLMNYIWLFVMHFFNLPIEEMVKNKYLNEAKKILADRSDLIKIGITGSYGKTSSKNIIQEVISDRYFSLMTPGSYNTPMGITRTIREMLKPLHQVFVCEMGADHVGDISYLCDFVKPTIGLVTSIGPQHLQTFGSQENIINEKMQMIEKLPPNGVGIINNDNDFIRNYQVKNTCKLVSYGMDHEADYMAYDVSFGPTGSTFKVKGEGEEYEFETKLLGRHNVDNILSAIVIGRQLGVTWKDLQKAVKRVKYVEHRLEIKKINGLTFIDDAFNSNPVGSAMALEVLSSMPGKRFIVTPGMIDLGERQDEFNKEFGKKMKGCADEVILVGEKQTQAIVQGLKEVGFDEEHLHVCKNVKGAFALVYQMADETSTILLENDLPDAFNV